MDESALERYFEDSIANDSGFLLEEELSIGSPTLSSTYLPGKAGLSRGSGEELDLSFLPDELGTQEEPSRHNDTAQTEAQAASQDS
uniref:Uncharacterized protein n=2 Tax=Tetraodon nigroviridis TaxID=99883 RepID=H3C303_TETNG